MIVIGIDPGLHGAIAIYNSSVESLKIFDIPIRQLKINGKNRLQINPWGLADVVRVCGGAQLAVIEDVHSMPRQGVVSSFKFGFVAGSIQQAIVSAGTPILLVQPQVWKRHFGLSGGNKEASRAVASIVLPAHINLWRLKKHDGRAEAALIALYGARLQTVVP